MATAGARKVTWDGSETIVGSVDELDAVLDRLAAEAERDTPLMAALVREDGASLSIGLGRAETLVTYIPGSSDPPYYISQGDGDRSEPIEFLSGGEMTEFPPWSAIPAADGRAAMRVFFETGELSPAITWEGG